MAVPRCSSLLAGIVLCASLGACSEPPKPPKVDARDRIDSGAGAPAPEDAGADAGDGKVRGDTPHWPEAEQEVELFLAGPAVERTIVVEADPSALDVQLNVDTTASMRFAIDELQGALRTTVIRRLREHVEDVAFGVSRFADFPLDPFGQDEAQGDADRAYELLTPITNDVGRVYNAVQRLDRPLGVGGDIPEASGEALFQIATGRGYEGAGRELIEPWLGPAAPGGGTLGGVGFRGHALHVVIHVADSPSHDPADYDEGGLAGTHSLVEATGALNALGARVVSILPTVCDDAECRAQHPNYAETRAELSELALATSAVIAAERGACRTGIDRAVMPSYGELCPLVFDARGDGSGLSKTLSDAVIALLREVRFGEVHAELQTDPLQFVEAIRVLPVAQSGGLREPEQRDRLPEGALDGVPDSYVGVERGMKLGFAVRLRNTRIAATASEQRFRVALRVIGDGVLLEEKLLRVVIPAGAQVPLEGDTSGRDMDAGD
jgi:hypothetical protein